MSKIVMGTAELRLEERPVRGGLTGGVYRGAICAWGLTFALLMAAVWGAPGSGQTQKPVQPKQPVLLSPEDNKTLTERFIKDIWPLLARQESGCLTCHDSKSATPLHLLADPEGTFKALLVDGHLDSENPGSILARVSAPDRARKMPPAPNKPWTDAEIQTLRGFANDLYEALHKSGMKMDEMFPPALLRPYAGATPPTGFDNTFLTLYQLKGKIKAIFGDYWRRNDRDQFNENIELFNGADFVRRFDESNKASAGFLTGVDLMARDVASRVYLARTGPFREFPASLPAPTSLKAPDAAYRHAVHLLYDRLLFRSPSEAEMLDAFRFLQGVYREKDRLAGQDQEARFELSVRDEQGRSSVENFTVHILADRHGLYQAYVDESEKAEGVSVKKRIGETFTLKAGDSEQRLEVSNRGTSGNVSVAGVELKGPLPPSPAVLRGREQAEATTKTISIADAGVQAQGAWRLLDRAGLKSYEDDNQNKGDSRIVIPLRVERDGTYEVLLLWRKNDGFVGPRGQGGASARNVPVEIFSHDRSRLAPPPAPLMPPKGEAHFAIDQSNDTTSYVELKTAFRFGPQGGVEISNTDTHRTVVADCVRFVPAQGGEAITVTSDRADGHEGWSDYNPGAFSYYRKITGKLLSDGNAGKGEKRLLFRPSVEKGWKPDALYRVQVYYPGRAQNETQTPILVRAEESAPIAAASYPARATVGAAVTLGASDSYNVQRSPVAFTWRQMGGPRIAVPNPHAPTLTFVAPAMTAQQAAWEGLCRALMKHPDFLFTRPRSLAIVTDPKARRRLQLVKIAQDLVGRTPSESELRRIDSGAPLGALVDDYLKSAEFREFYFRRIRLYLESRGTDVDDEPVRLWCYIAFNDRPFKEILTADYTVDANLQRQPRPAYYGKTGVLTMKGFIRGKPGLPHFNYAAQVAEKFLGYVFEVPPEVVAMRNTITAVSTTNPNTLCYSCHKILTPLAYQRGQWTDDGDYRPTDDDEKPIDASDQGLVPSYPFKGLGLEAFATQAQSKERFVRTILQTHFIFYFGREMRWEGDERELYKRLWDRATATNYAIRPILKTLFTSPEYLNGTLASQPTALKRNLTPK